MKISVIIPCYNMEMYLEECLNSILIQNLEGIEIICIDDGSSDGTEELLKGYQKRYNNIYFIRQMNAGAGEARNNGIRQACGEYIAFMDADDFYPDIDVLKYLYDTATEYNANVCGGSLCSYRNGVYTYEGFRKGMVFEENGWINKQGFLTYAGFWRFIYKRDFLVNNNIWFPDYKRFQDPPFFLKAISKAEKVYCIKKIVYCYRKEHKTVNFDKKKGIDFVKGVRDSLMIAKEERLDSIYTSLEKELHGEATALMYYFVHEGSEEMARIIHEINLIISGDGEHEKRRLLEGKNLNEYVEKVWMEREELFGRLSLFPHILIFGAGTVGKKVLNFFRQHQHEPEAFIVSDLKQNPSEVEGIPVRLAEEYINIQNSCLVVVATFSYLHEEIRDVMHEKGFEQLYFIDLEKFYLWCGGVVH